MASTRSGGLEECFEADPEILLVLEAVEQGELIGEDGAEGEALGAGQPAGRHRAVGIEDALELAVEVLDGVRAELMGAVMAPASVRRGGVPATAPRLPEWAHRRAIARIQTGEVPKAVAASLGVHQKTLTEALARRGLTLAELKPPRTPGTAWAVVHVRLTVDHQPKRLLAPRPSSTTTDR